MPSALQHGKLHSDGVEYFDFYVDDSIVGVTVSVARNAVGSADCGSRCDSELELFLRFGAFPTRINHDQRVAAGLIERGEMVVEQLRVRAFLCARG
jgi:hypothetical protein